MLPDELFCEPDVEPLLLPVPVPPLMPDEPLVPEEPLPPEVPVPEEPLPPEVPVPDEPPVPEAPPAPDVPEAPLPDVPPEVPPDMPPEELPDEPLCCEPELEPDCLLRLDFLVDCWSDDELPEVALFDEAPDVRCGSVEVLLPAPVWA